LREEFRRWDVIFDSHFKANEALIASYTERLISVEERLSDLERK